MRAVRAGLPVEVGSEVGSVPVLVLPVEGTRNDGTRKVNPYGYRWRVHLRPAILRRDDYRCVFCGRGDSPSSVNRSSLTVAHLSGDVSDNSDENLATLCWPCHNRHDAPVRMAAYRLSLIERRERRIDAADAARPILALLQA